MDLLEEYLAKERSTFMENETRFVHSGRKDRIPSSLAALIAEVEEETKDQTRFTLHLAIDYGGKDEVVRALGKTKDHSEEGIAQALDHSELSDIDLIIRTSGEHRTSNFFLWQAAYAEWDFIDKFFPDFSVDDLANSVGKFADRTRRFGG